MTFLRVWNWSVETKVTYPNHAAGKNKHAAAPTTCQSFSEWHMTTFWIEGLKIFDKNIVNHKVDKHFTIVILGKCFSIIANEGIYITTASG